MGIVRFIFSCITQAIKIAIGVAITIGLFFAAGYLVDVFASKKTAPPADPKLRPYADHGMPLAGSPQNDTSSSLYMSFFETLLNKKPDVMPQPEAEKKPGAAMPPAAAAAGGAKQPGAPTSAPSAAQRVAEIKAAVAAAARQSDRDSALSENLIYTLQLGSFQNNEVAAAFSSSLAAKGYASYIVQITVPDKGVVYRVRIGKYRSLEDAQKMAAELEKKEGISAFITSK
ncbi:MAG: SPOR domain-containing protein [Deltaproteobacteria bacterium]|nr:SPOR domain-containing protein [Deltaproteobacteria bacterium]